MGAEEPNNSPPEERETANQRLPDRVTQADFLSWKRRKDAEASAKKAGIERKRREDIAAGLVPMNGRELFQSEPWMEMLNIWFMMENAVLNLLNRHESHFAENQPSEFCGKTSLEYNHGEFSRLMFQADVKTAKFWQLIDTLKLISLK